MQQLDLGQFPYREFIWGIGGTARYAKIAGHTAPNFYVDSTHPNAHADNDGTDPEAPFALVQSAVDSPFLVARSTIFVSGAVTEAVTVPSTVAEYVNLVAVGSVGYGAGQPVLWTPAAGDALRLGTVGWTVEGFRFRPAADGAGVRLQWDGDENGSDATIRACFFDGRWGTGLYGIDFVGSPYNCTIRECRFTEFSVGQPCIVTRANGIASAFQTYILNNMFQECAEYITVVAEGYNASIIMGNVFADATAVLAATTTFIDLGGPGHGANVVTQNIFGGTYSNAGGYTAEGAGTDNWVGNYAADVASPQVGDNGLTIAQPV